MPRPAVTIAARAARSAGNIILRYMNRIDGLNIVEKQQMDFVSEVDKLAEAEIIKELRRAYPDHAILGEESGAIGKGPLQWVIDPLDGTHNYLRGIPHFCVSIALLEKGVPIHARGLRPAARRAVHRQQGRRRLPQRPPHARQQAREPGRRDDRHRLPVPPARAPRRRSWT